MKGKTIEFEGMSIELEQGEFCRVLYDYDINIPFQCLQGKCGRCLIKIVKGNLGTIQQNEETLLKVLGLEVGLYRLLCQCTLEENTIIEKV